MRPRTWFYLKRYYWTNRASGVCDVCLVKALLYHWAWWSIRNVVEISADCNLDVGNLQTVRIHHELLHILSFIKSESKAFWLFCHFWQRLPAKSLQHSVTKEQMWGQTAFLVSYLGFSQDGSVRTYCSLGCGTSVFWRFPSTTIPYPLTYAESAISSIPYFSIFCY